MNDRPRDRPSLAESARRRALSQVIRARLVIAPVIGGVALTFAFFEPTRWRRATLIAAVTLLFGLSVVEFLRYRRYGVKAVLVPLNAIATAGAQLAVISATGGLFSPAVPPVLILVLITALLAERRTPQVLVALTVPAFWVLAAIHSQSFPVPSLLPSLFGGAQAIEHGPAPYIAAAFFTFIVVMVFRVGSGLQRLFTELYEEGIRERDHVLALHGEQSRALTTLSAEIAHELKNPLSSVKGLAALLAKDSEGRSAERLAVLRREVDRMQTILEEFLNFSRPLVPLAVAEVDLVELARDVVRLHEGTAVEHEVELRVTGKERLALRCDLRKTRQILINLLQNALAASPPRSAVEVHVGLHAATARVRVRDHGAGISPEVAARLFEPGVTDKEHGSGLGLVVARSLARQHGGDLTLGNAEGGGALAELTLPLAANGVEP